MPKSMELWEVILSHIFVAGPFVVLGILLANHALERLLGHHTKLWSWIDSWFR